MPIRINVSEKVRSRLISRTVGRGGAAGVSEALAQLPGYGISREGLNKTRRANFCMHISGRHYNAKTLGELKNQKSVIFEQV